MFDLEAEEYAEQFVTVERAAEMMQCSVVRVRWLARNRLIACRWDGRADYMVNPEIVVTV